MNNRYVLQGLLCIVIHAALVESVVPVEQLRQKENSDLKVDQKNVQNVVPDKLQEERNDGIDHNVKKSLIIPLPLEPKRENNVVYAGANLVNIPKSSKPKPKKLKLTQEEERAPAGDIDFLENPIPPKKIKLNQDLHSLNKGDQLPVLPVANINFTNDDFPKEKRPVVKSNNEAPQFLKNDKKTDTNSHHANQNNAEENSHAKNIQQQAELRKLERENARRSQDNERQEKERYQKNQEHQIQRHAEETKTKKSRPNHNQNMQSAINENGDNVDNFQNKKEQHNIAHYKGEGEAHDKQNIDRFPQEKQHHQQESQFDVDANKHQNQDVADAHNNHPFEDFILKQLCVYFHSSA